LNFNLICFSLGPTRQSPCLLPRRSTLAHRAARPRQLAQRRLSPLQLARAALCRARCPPPSPRALPRRHAPRRPRQLALRAGIVPPRPSSCFSLPRPFLPVPLHSASLRRSSTSRCTAPFPPLHRASPRQSTRVAALSSSRARQRRAVHRAVPLARPCASARANCATAAPAPRQAPLSHPCPRRCSFAVSASRRAARAPPSSPAYSRPPLPISARW
jgi:hypothetical protein